MPFIIGKTQCLLRTLKEVLYVMIKNYILFERLIIMKRGVENICKWDVNSIKSFEIYKLMWLKIFIIFERELYYLYIKNLWWFIYFMFNKNDWIKKRERIWKVIPYDIQLEICMYLIYLVFCSLLICCVCVLLLKYTWYLNYCAYFIGIIHLNKSYKILKFLL